MSNTYNDLNVSISNYGNLKLGGLKTNYLYDSLGTTGLTNYILTTTPTGVRWLSGSTNVDVSGKLDISVFTSFETIRGMSPFSTFDAYIPSIASFFVREKFINNFKSAGKSDAIKFAERGYKKIFSKNAKFFLSFYSRDN